MLVNQCVSLRVGGSRLCHISVLQLPRVVIMQEQASSIVKPLILAVTHLDDHESNGEHYVDGRALRYVRRM